MNAAPKPTTQAMPWNESAHPFDMSAAWWVVSLLVAFVMIVFACVWDGGLQHTDILIRLRVPRVLAAFGVGGLLALSGVLLQALLRNPLADPYLLGVASGASASLLIGTVLGMSWWVLQLWAFAGAIGVLMGMSWVMHRYSRMEGDLSVVLLLGVLLSSMLNALVSALLLILPERALRGALFWMMGDLAGSGQHYIAWMGVWLCLLLALPLARPMHALMRGTVLAHAVGVSVRRLRIQLLLIAGLATALAVAEAGAIGFVGLVVPHVVKRVCAQRTGDMRMVLVLSVLWGGTLLVLADTMARAAFSPLQLPVGIFTVGLGAPFLAWQLMARMRLTRG